MGEDSLHPDLAALIGQTIAGRYRVDDVLGVGGMGVVFQGHHEGLKRDVAIKVLHPELTRDPEISARFDREAHSASRLDHPNCLQVTDVGTTDNDLKFMVMQLLQGGELAEQMGVVMPPDRATVLVLQILRGLEHAHEQGVVHRDVKPENVFITRDHDGRETLKLVDFGIAKLAGGGADGGRKMTKAGLIFGTPAYMSPEQAMGQDADARADLYAVGVILYEMLAGRTPFLSDDPVSLVRMQVTNDPPPLPESIPAPLVEIVLRLLAKQRGERYQTATEARIALESLLPYIATTEISSPTLLPHSLGSAPIPVAPSAPASGSGPIPVARTGSGTIPPGVPGYIPPSASGSMPHSSAAMSVSQSMPASQRADSIPSIPSPMMPPPVSGARRKPVPWPLVGGGLAALGIIIAIAVGSGGDESEAAAAGSDAEVAAKSESNEGSEPAGEADAEVAVSPEVGVGPTEQQLVEIDKLTMANKRTEADAILGPLLDQYPDNAVLLWRQGRLLTKSRRRNRLAMALTVYGKALESDPDIVDDPDFYAELLVLLREDKLRDQALDTALRQMDDRGHKFLAELVNDTGEPLDYEDRHRALDVLDQDEKMAGLVDRRLNRALDVLQAHQALTPCTAYLEALDVIAAEPEFFYYPRVEKAELPQPKIEEEISEAEKADAARCPETMPKRDQVLEQLAALDPEGVVIIEDEGGEEAGDEPVGDGTAAAPDDPEATPAAGADAPGEAPADPAKPGGKKKKGSAKKGSSKKGGAKKGPNCNRFGAILDSRCR